ncbi:MAG TPA: GGDEF domain-containing protein [Aquificales bacterium]|nr:GGDEF domain-containing protein [Aquificales bacterium]
MFRKSKEIFSNKAKDIFSRIFFYTNLVIFLLIFLIPIGAFLLTGHKEYISPMHFVLVIVVGLLQIAATRYYKNILQQYWNKVKTSLIELAKRLNSVKTLKDIEEVRSAKKKLLEPLLEEENFSNLAKSLNVLVDNVLNIFESKLFKEELIRRLTTTLNVDRLSHILSNSLLKNFDIPAVAIYLKAPNANEFELKINKGFGEIKPILDETFIQKIQAKDDVLIKETLDVSIDKGVCNLPIKEIYVHKLIPRSGKFIGVLMFGFERHDQLKEDKLREFLEEIEPTIALIFENALEHEKSLMLASLDPLTGVYNRREGFKLIKKLLSKAAVERTNICILILDIDHFKKINDTYGHEIGDLVLKEVVKIIRSSVRDRDLIIRWGGEEFLIVLNNVPPEKAKDVAERIRVKLENHEISIGNNITLKVTASIGVACTELDGIHSFDELFEIADKRVYKAKNSGRNQVVAD